MPLVIDPPTPAIAAPALAAPDTSAVVTHSETLAIASASPAWVPPTEVAESPAITASADLVAAAEPAELSAGDTVSGEPMTVEAETDPRLIALQSIDIAPTNARDIVADVKPEPATEPAEPEPVTTALEPSDVAPVLQDAEAVDVVPTEVREVPEQIVVPSPPPVEEETLTTIEPRPIDEMWDTALATAEQGETPEAAAPSFASPPETITEPAIIEAEPLVSEPAPLVEAAAPDTHTTLAPIVQESAVTPLRAIRELQLVLSPVTSFPQLLAIQQRIASLSSVNGIHLRDFRNGVATFGAGVTDALSGREFASVLQLLTELQLRLEGATENSVELHVGPQTR